MRSHHVLAEAGTLADHDRTDEACKTRIDVNDGAAGEVKRAPAEDQAVCVPDHVCDREVDEGDPEQAEEHGSRELDAFGKRADDQNRRQGRKRHLE
ncbi:hypothetical protein D3C71_844640 [compost metagenome]